MAKTEPRHRVATAQSETQLQLEFQFVFLTPSEATEVAAVEPRPAVAKSGSRRKVAPSAAPPPAPSAAPTAAPPPSKTAASSADTDDVGELYATLTAATAALNTARRKDRSDPALISMTVAIAKESFCALLARNIALALDITEAAENETDDKLRAQLAKHAHALNLSTGRLILMLERIERLAPGK